MRRQLITVAGALALVCASTALAGGWATVKLSSSPKGLSAGEPWVVDITVLQHGLASQPLCCLSPTVTIRKVAAVDRPHRRLPRTRRVPQRRQVALRGLRRLHRVRRRPYPQVRTGEGRAVRYVATASER